MDPDARKAVEDLLRSLLGGDTTVHNVIEEIEEMVDEAHEEGYSLGAEDAGT